MTRFVHIIGKYFLLLLAFTAVLFTSCKRDALLSPIYEGDGREVTINIPVYFTEYEQKTRALTEKESKRLDNLYLFAFQSSTGKLQFRRFYDTAELLTLSDAVSQDKHSDAKVVPITLPTGTYKIAAVANCNAGHLKQGVQDRLLQIENWDEFFAVDLELNEYNPLTRSRMPMSGYYQIGDNVDCAGTLTCPDVVVNGQGDLGGYIHLRRVDAEVKFNIYNDIDGHYTGLDGSSGDYMQTCTKFEVLGWQLVNMPAGAYLAEHESDKPDVTYVSTGIQGIDRPDPNVGDGAWTLDFYIMENRKDTTGLTKYEQRELNEANEEREEDEDPHFIKAPSNSTYLKFSANIEIALTKGSETVKRIASATYYVHLGATYPKGGTPTVDYNDFKTARNTKYTYNVRVQGVDKIVVEAISTEDPNDNFQNGQEGMVVDLAGGKVIDLDAHYAVFNIELSRLEISQMGLIITSAAHPSGVSYIPGAGPGGSDLNNLNITCDDYQHIRFAPLAAQKEKTPGSELVVYSNTYDVKALSEHPTEAQAKEGGILPLEDEPTQAKDTDHYVPLYDFITLKKSYPLLDDGHDEDPITFTVFVSEYYYYNDFNLHHDTDLGEENWQKFTNTINRQYSLLSNVHVSSDEHSTHVTGKYVINQRSIQTYYGMDSEEGLGIEHVNEHYHKNMYASNPSTKRKNNGWFNSAFYMGLMNSGGSATNSARWADWASQDRAIGQESTNDFYPTFKTKFSDGLIADGNYKGSKNGISTADRDVNYDAIPACLARNRDLNRNGIIETDELRWFLPGIQQYVQFAIGIAALETPIFRPSDFVNSEDYDTKGGRANNIYGNVRYHFISSDNWKMWSEEGTSISTLSGASVANAWEIRCCRYLKANGAYTSSDNQLIVAHPYNHNDETRVVNVHGYDEKCIRENTAVLPVRDNFDTKWNSLARNFQYASTTIDRPNAGTMSALARDVDANVYCRTYHDPAFGSDMSDVGTWRIPNQRELAIMFYEGKAADGYFAGTFWYYGNYTNNIVYGYDDVAAESGSKYFGNFGIRSGNLCLNHSNNLNTCRIIRCVRDTDSDGHYMNDPLYGKVLDFKFGQFTGSAGNYSVTATMHPDAVASVTIDGVGASVSQSGNTFKANATGIENTYSLRVTWTIEFYGKTYTYSKVYVLKNSPFYAFRDNDNKTKAVTVSNDLSALRTESLDDSQLPDDCRWVLLRKNASGFEIETPVVPTNSSYLSTKYILYNIGTAQYLGTSTSGTNNANNFTMVSERSQALEFDLGGNNWGKLFRVSIGGTNNGYFDRKTDWSIGVNSGLRHSWYFTLRSYVSSITLDPSSVELMPGQTATISATVLPLDAANRDITWSSSNNGVATVNNGVVTAVGAGTATITATAADGNGAKATCAVTVIQPVTSIELNQTSLELEVGPAAVNTSATLSATVLPDTASDKSLIWESSNPDVVTVSAGPATKSVSGTSVTVTAVGVGEATITATANDGSGVQQTCSVTVKNPVILVTGITLSPSPAAVAVNSTITLTPTITPSDADNKEVTWSCNNSNATVDQSGNVTGKAVGTAIITATAADGSGVTATCTVTILPAGALTREFTVNSSGKKVYFSKGNLYWNGSTYQFEATQYYWWGHTSKTRVGSFYYSSKADIARADSYSSSGRTNPEILFTNSTETAPNANFTVNGVKGKYRSLSFSEWNYLVNSRSGNRYAKGKVNNINGLILLPDGYVHPSDVPALKNINKATVDYSGNNFNTTQWAKLEAAGAVFLLCHGYRSGIDLHDTGTRSYYLSSTCSGLSSSKVFYFNSNDIYTSSSTFYNIERKYAHSIRLVVDK